MLFDTALFLCRPSNPLTESTEFSVFWYHIAKYLRVHLYLMIRCGPALFNQAVDVSLRDAGQLQHYLGGSVQMACKVVICDAGLLASQVRRSAGFETLTPREVRRVCEAQEVLL